MRKQAINIDDCFVSIDSPSLVWTVSRFVEYSGLPPHVELKCSRDPNRVVTIGEVVLRDKGFYRKIDPRTRDSMARHQRVRLVPTLLRKPSGWAS